MYILPFIVVISFAMISPLRFPKTGLKINAFAAVFILVTIIFGSMYYNFAPVMLFFAVAAYSIIGSIYIRKKLFVG
jgi:phosphatidylserine synthase